MFGKSKCCLSALALATALFFFGPLSVQAGEGFKLLKIDPDAKAAVVKNEDGKLSVLRQGDDLKDLGRIMSISAGRIVLQNDMAEKIIIKFENGKQAMQRFGKIDRTSKGGFTNAVTAAGGGADPATGGGRRRQTLSTSKE